MNLYFNNAFSKQPLEEAVRAMQPFLRQEYENPLTESDGGELALEKLEESRKRVAGLLGAKASEITYVSSGTEANNWALKGPVAASRKQNKHIVISAVEHFSVFQTAMFLRKQGVDVTILPVNSEGRLMESDVEQAIRPETILVSMIAGSDEIGVTQQLEAVTRWKSQFPDVLFHTDAIQYICYEELDTQVLPFDLVSLSSNAIYGPHGIAALYIRDGTRMVPLLHGGMQEDGLRPGLQSLSLAVGFGEAANACQQGRRSWRAQLRNWRDRLMQSLDELQVPVTGSRIHRLADNVHAIADVDGEAMLTLLRANGVGATTGSTCYQYAQKESHVLTALGISRESARGAVLFTGSIYQSEEDAVLLAKWFKESLETLRRLKPA